jgi:alkylation response protein AidB-like acyl-CoA dehydrogenase/flavin-dependent dehydrogenase/electron transfer flavoprotein alpha subunit/electron transfer flavoprotein alpha/beta subunit/ferredoxin-like protein FixX
MELSNYDVIVVGAGSAGLTAAIGLTKAGFTVAVLEAAAFPGAENWSGCVYFCENLVHSDILGLESVEALAWERRLVERGFFASDGFGLLGMKYRDPAAFRHCYTVLRPIFDHHLAQTALRLGVALVTNTTVESLIREKGRVIGVSTNRGPLYGDLVFLAEGDASHLVTREGYERFTDQREVPKFLQGIKQVINLPPGAIEEIFEVGPEEGVAYEILLRNCTLHGRSVHLNMGGFVYTNRQSLSVGLVLPADNLREQFDGDPNLLMEWFENLPALRPWLREGKPGVFGAKIIRGGGAKDIPHLIDEGLAIGGAASAIGVDFPYPNFTGPATAMGLILTQAACKIRATGGGFTRENLRRYYLEPLERTHYWQDVEFLRRWPGYVKRTQVFFGRNLDLALGTAYIWTRPRCWFVTKWVNWLRLLLHFAGPGHWQQTRTDMRHLFRALRLREVVSRPTFGRLLLDGTINALRDLARSPRANLPPAGTIRIHFTVADDTEPAIRPPAVWRRWFDRFAPVLASAARRIYSNNDVPLADKLPESSRLLLRQINILDFLAAAILALATVVSGAFTIGWIRFTQALGRRRTHKLPRGLYPRYASAARGTTDLTSSIGAASQRLDGRLAQLSYQAVKSSHIHVLWPKSLQDRNAVVSKGLWHVCPAHVYEARATSQGQLQVIVNFENCIKCETCWRTSDLVDWGRDGVHRFVYPVGSPVVTRLLAAAHSTGVTRPALPHLTDRWAPIMQALAKNLATGSGGPPDGQQNNDIDELYSLLAKLEGKLEEFDSALAREPRTVDRARCEYLEMLARYGQQLASRVVDVLRESALADSLRSGVVEAHRHLLELAVSLLDKSELRARRTWDQRFAWAAADGRQIRQHHLPGLRRYLAVLGKHVAPSHSDVDPSRQWLRAEDDAAQVAKELAEWTTRLDVVFGPTAWREIDRQMPLNSAQDAVLRELIAHIPAVDPADLERTLHPSLRKALLAELGGRDPSLAYRVASHLWARDLARLRSTSPHLSEAAERWSHGEEWACFASIEAVQTGESGWKGEALFIAANGARSLLLLVADRLILAPADSPGLRIEPLPTLGLRGAGLARVCLENFVPPETSAAADSDRVLRVWQVLSAADLTSIAAGMADLLCRRAISHANSRIQFPGLFHDEEARDSISKFGAIKKMLAQMAVRRYLVQTLDHSLSPNDFSNASVERACLIKAIVAEALGTAPGSLSYNAGQVFGGTGYSEDDILAKYYRDAAAWRFLGLPNVDIHRRHGEQLLRSWHPDGRRLASLAHEAELFDQVAQRKALQAELDEIRVLRSRLRSLINDWQNARREHATAVPGANNGSLSLDASAVAEITELVARQDAFLLADKALLLRTHARLEHHLDSETEATLLRVWLEEAAESFEKFDSIVHQRLEPNGRDSRPLVDPAAGPPVDSYAGYLAERRPYDSGDFLSDATDLIEPRAVPELTATDPVLASTDRQFRELLLERFGGLRADGLTYERYLERQHRPDPDDLDFCRRQGFFRLPIPKDLGGEGRSKMDYYLLIMNAQRAADFALALTIQVSSSIGTTPILLARDKDLPRAQEELAAFLADPALVRGIQNRLEKLLRVAASANFRRLEQLSRELSHRLEEAISKPVVLRNPTQGFRQAWQEVERACEQLDMPALRTHLDQALDQWKAVRGRAEELRSELARRRDACDLFLRWIASGQISAFALTEPSAGSDTARVASRARPRSVPVTVEADGALRFVPAGGNELRYLLDASRLEFRNEGVYYRWSDVADAARIQFDEYDYETDDPQRTRYYNHGARRIHFTDIAQLRERDGRVWYDYWEVTGAKMWITNGRMAGVFSLYAKTEEGVTGFIVDRHAEGLIVGKDEAKMGQLGSPTNELSLQAVRVPRENVLGLEGRGQVNALETLNVGRTGLAVTSMAQMAGLIEQSRSFAHATFNVIPDWVECRLQRMEEDRFIAEALTYEVVGLFEHPLTKSVRLESAIAKMLVTELLHRAIDFAEDIYGLAGQTQLHLVEKRKRDARILTIYEGTNEIQRFFVLKDLATEVAPRWPRAGRRALQGYMGPEALQLEALKSDVRQRISAALQVFGQDLWQNPNMQANCFLLSEAAAWLKAVDSVLGRLAWMERQAHSDDNAEPSPRMLLARRALIYCHSEVRRRLRRFDEELAHLRRGYYAPEVRAASLLCDRADSPEPSSTLPSSMSRPLSILVIVDAPAPYVPCPQIGGGRLLEPHLTLSAADRSVLEAALQLRDQATAPVSIQVATVGPKRCAPALREALSLGVDRVRLVVTEAEAVSPDSAANALASVVGDGSVFDLILGSSGGTESTDGLLSLLTAESLDIPSVGRTAQLIVHKNDAKGELSVAETVGGRQRVHPLPAAVLVTNGKSLRSFTTDGYLTGLTKIVEVERWPKKVTASTLFFRESVDEERTNGRKSESADQATLPLSARAAAQQALEKLGIHRGSAVPPKLFEGSLEDVSSPLLPESGIIAIVAADAAGRLQSTASSTVQAAAKLAAFENAGLGILVLVSPDEEGQRRAIAQVLLCQHAETAVLLCVREGKVSSPDVNRWMLKGCWRHLNIKPRIVVGEPWSEGALMYLSRHTGMKSVTAFRVRRVDVRKERAILESRRATGKLRVEEELSYEPGCTWWITVAPEAEIDADPVAGSGAPPRAQRWTPRLERLYGRHEIDRLLEDVQQEAKLVRLADAEFIVDAGFGVGNRDGYEAVIEPLEKALHKLGVRSLMVGGSRKVTEELRLLPAERQIGQSGERVNPQILLAIGVSGAPQHLNYIGAKTTILAFNRDPEAPIMTLNQRQPRPRVYPIVGDLFETVPAFIAALEEKNGSQMQSNSQTEELATP